MKRMLLLLIAFPTLVLGQAVLGPVYKLAAMDESLFPTK
jgi:hypothetical protein